MYVYIYVLYSGITSQSAIRLHSIRYCQLIIHIAESFFSSFLDRDASLINNHCKAPPITCLYKLTDA